MRRKWILIFVLISFLALPVFSGPKKASQKTLNELQKVFAKNPAWVADEIIVKFDPSLSEAEKDAIAKKYNLTLKRKSRKAGKFRVFKHNDPEAILNSLKNEPGVIYAERNAYAYALMVPNDPYYKYQWHMTRIGVEDAWDLSTGSGVIVAVVDTGIKQTLEDLANTQFVPGYDFVNEDNDPTDDEGHGSHVAGTIAQSTNNGVGVVGIAFNAKLMPVKVLDSRGSGTYDDIADGIYYAVDNGADIINMSLGGPSSLDILEDAVNYAWSHGVVVVCAAGNESTSDPSYPAAYDAAISVSATTSIDTLASYSNYGSTIDIAAPGGDTGDNNGDGYDDMILQNTFSRTDEGYYFYAGTSMASPHVAGTAALVKAANPNLTNAEIREILETTAEDLGDPGWDQYFGNGLVNAYAAVQAALGGGGGGGDEDTTPPTISNINVTNITSNSVTITWTTDEPATSKVYYGLTTSYGNTAYDGSYVTSHSVTLTGLSAGTTYHFMVESADQAGNVSQSSDYTFTTQEEEPQPSGVMYVDSIDMSLAIRGRWYYAVATVKIVDTQGNPVSGATVYVTWSGVVSGTSSGITGTDGTVTFTSARTSGGTYTITVTNVTHDSYTYDSSLNNETTDSVSN